MGSSTWSGIPSRRLSSQLWMGPIEVPSGADEEDTLTVFVRAPEDADVLVEPGAAVCVLSQCSDVEEEISHEIAVEDVAEVQFEGDPPPPWTQQQLRQFHQQLLEREPSADPEAVWHMANLAGVFDLAARGGLSFKHSKSQLLQHQLKLLGTVTGRDGLAPDPEKIKALQLFPPPRNKGQLREFFGTINLLRPPS